MSMAAGAESDSAWLSENRVGSYQGGTRGMLSRNESVPEQKEKLESSTTGEIREGRKTRMLNGRQTLYGSIWE